MEIDKAQRLFFNLVIPEILDVRVRSRDKFRVIDSLDQISFKTQTTTNSNGIINIDLQILDIQQYSKYLLSEANRFYIASRHTLERSKQSIGRGAAWQAIEHYYAAYFSIHYLIRLTGVSITNLDDSAVKQIGISNYTSTATAQIPTGLYTLQFNNSNNYLNLTKTAGRTGGSHQEAWHAWETLVSKISHLTTTDIIEYARLSVDLATHLKFLSKSTKKYNPPELRAEINYQFKQRTWAFEEKSSIIIEKIRRNISIESITHSSTYDVHALIENNKLIINLANAVFNDIAKKYPKSVTNLLKGQNQDVIA